MMQNEAPSPLQMHTPPGAGPFKEERLQPRGRADVPSDSSVAVRHCCFYLHLIWATAHEFDAQIHLIESALRPVQDE